MLGRPIDHGSLTFIAGSAGFKEDCNLGLNIKMNSTVVVSCIGMDPSKLILNSGQRMGELIFTYPLRDGVWNFAALCVKVISLWSTPVSLHDRRHMEEISCWMTILYWTAVLCSLSNHTTVCVLSAH